MATSGWKGLLLAADAALMLAGPLYADDYPVTGTLTLTGGTTAPTADDPARCACRSSGKTRPGSGRTTTSTSPGFAPRGRRIT
jgi:hypothetical protein